MFQSPFDQPSYKPKAKKKTKKKVVRKAKKKVAKKATRRKLQKCDLCPTRLPYEETYSPKGSGMAICEACAYEVGHLPREAKKKKKKKKKKAKIAKKAKKKATKKAKKTRSKVPNPFNMLKPTAAKNKKVNAAITRAIGYVAWGEARGSSPNMEFVQSLFYSHVQPTLYEVSETDTETNDAVFAELAAQAVEAIAKAKKKKTKKKKVPSRSRVPSSSLGGIRVHCVREGGKIRVRPVPGQGYPSTKNIQFPRDLRHEGCQYIVDALDDKGTHFRAVGEIRPF